VTMLLTATSPHGMVMAADTRLTWDSVRHEDGHRKIVPWPEMRAAIGFAGLAALKSAGTDEIIQRYISYRRWETLGEYALGLAAEFRRELHPGASGDQRRIYVHVAGFGSATADQAAQFHYVRNSEWEEVLGHFQVNEDLRYTYLHDRGIRSLADLAASEFFRVQFSGVRDVFAARAQENLDREATHLHDLNDVANWARGQIRAVALDLVKERRTPVVGEEAVVYRMTPDAVVLHG